METPLLAMNSDTLILVNDAACQHAFWSGDLSRITDRPGATDGRHDGIFKAFDDLVQGLESARLPRKYSCSPSNATESPFLCISLRAAHVREPVPFI